MRVVETKYVESNSPEISVKLRKYVVEFLVFKRTDDVFVPTGRLNTVKKNV